MTASSALPHHGSLILASAASAIGEQASLEAAARHHELTVVRRGVYVDSATWKELSGTQKYLQEIAAVRYTRADVAFSSYSAAALHRLPIIGSWPKEVHLVCPSTVGGKRRNGVVEHYRRGDEQIVLVDGVTVTSVAQTVVEIARVESFLCGVVIADAALYIDRFGRTPPRCGRDELEAAYAMRLPFPGSRKVRRVLDFATTQAESPLESLSRVVIWEEGFPEPTLQHKLWLPHSGRWIWLDFAWLDYNAFGEADGNGKYLGTGDLGEANPAGVVIAEKKRESEVRGLRYGIDRWDWTEAWGRRVLRAKLLDLGLPIVRQPSHARHPRAR